MLCMGFETGATAWQAQKDPLSCGFLVPLSAEHYTRYTELLQRSLLSNHFSVEDFYFLVKGNSCFAAQGNDKKVIFKLFCRGPNNHFSFLSLTPTLMAFTVVTNAHGPSPQPPYAGLYHAV